MNEVVVAVGRQAAGLGTAFATLVAAIWVGWAIAAGRRDSEIGLGVAAWIGWYVSALTVLALGWAGFLTRSALWLPLLVAAAGLWLTRRSFAGWLVREWARLRAVLGGPRWLLVATAGLVLWLGLQLAVPIFQYDTITYGFGEPLRWLGDQAIRATGPDIYGFVAVPARMQATWALGLAGPPAASFQLLLWTLLAALLAAQCSELLGLAAPWPLLTAAAVLITPGVWDLLLARKDDLVVLWGGAALLALALGVRRRRRLDLRQAAVIGVAAAALLTMKPAATAAYVLALLVAVVLWQDGEASAPRGVATAVMAAAAVVGLLPVVAHTWAALGSPLAPALPYLGRFPLTSTRWHVAFASAYPWHPGGLTGQLHQLADTVVRFFDPRRWNFGDNLGIVLLVGVPAALLQRRWPALGAIWLTFAVGFFLTFHRPRFGMVAVALGAVLVVGLLERLLGPGRASAVLTAALAVHLAFYVVTAPGGALRLALGDHSVTGLEIEPSSVLLARWVNRHLDPERDRVLFIGEPRTFPCRVPFEAPSAPFRSEIERIPRGETPESHWDRVLFDSGATHMVYSPQVARAQLELSPRLLERLEKWIASRGRVVAVADSLRSRTVLVALKAGSATGPPTYLHSRYASTAADDAGTPPGGG